LVRSALLAQDEILIKYVKLLKGTKYKKRVKLLSKSLQKLNNDLSKLERFITEDYAPYADVENSAQIIEDTITLIDNIEIKFTELYEKEAMVKEKDVEIEDINKNLKTLAEHPERVAYQNALGKYTETQKSIDASFTNIRKSLRKYENIAAKSREKIDTTLVRELIKDAASCLANQSSLGSVEVLLRTILDQLNNTRLQLKKDKREATKEDITRLLNGDLQTYWDDSRNVKKARDDSLQRLNDLDLDAKINKLNSLISAISRDRNRILEREIRDIEKLDSEIKKQIDEINSRLNLSASKETMLQADIPDIPEWAIPI
jgi:hypothetical protein